MVGRIGAFGKVCGGLRRWHEQQGSLKRAHSFSGCLWLVAAARICLAVKKIYRAAVKKTLQNGLRGNLVQHGLLFAPANAVFAQQLFGVNRR